MRRLAANQRVEFIPDEANHVQADGIDCVVAWVKGAVGTLVCPGGLAPQARQQLTPAALGFLVFDHHGMPVALRGAAAADADNPMLEFVVLDGVQIPERRITNRVALAIPVRVNPASPEDPGRAPVNTTSRDLSITGALLKRTAGLGTGRVWKVELLVAGDEPPISCGAVVARRTPTHVGVAFTDLDASGHARLDQLLKQRERR
jgi:hypothetical protein